MLGATFQIWRLDRSRSAIFEAHRLIMTKRIYKKSVVVLLTTVVVAGAGVFMLSIFNLTNVAETSLDHQDVLLRTRHYQIKDDLKSMRRIVEQTVLTLRTWGGKWKLATAKNGDSVLDKEIIRATVPVVFFTDDLWIELKQEGNKVIVNAHSNSRIGKSDLGENRRHLLQILTALDKNFQ